MKIIWCMVPKIKGMTDRFLLFWAIFCPLTLLTTQKIIILKKWKKTPGDTITLHLCITNDDHIMYGSWDIEHNRHNFLLFYNIFYPFTSLVTWNIKILKKWKNFSRYYRFTDEYHKWQSYDVWFLKYDAKWTEFFVILDHFLPL